MTTRRRHTTRLMAVGLTLGLLASSSSVVAQADQPPVAVSVSPQPVVAGRLATVAAQTTSRAFCHARVTFASSFTLYLMHSSLPGAPDRADARGRITWHFLPPALVAGHATASVSCESVAGALSDTQMRFTVVVPTPLSVLFARYIQRVRAGAGACLRAFPLMQQPRVQRLSPQFPALGRRLQALCIPSAVPSSPFPGNGPSVDLGQYVIYAHACGETLVSSMGPVYACRAVPGEYHSFMQDLRTWARFWHGTVPAQW